jgi:hypothetical protein
VDFVLPRYKNTWIILSPPRHKHHLPTLDAKDSLTYKRGKRIVQPIIVWKILHILIKVRTCLASNVGEVMFVPGGDSKNM